MRSRFLIIVWSLTLAACLNLKPPVVTPPDPPVDPPVVVVPPVTPELRTLAVVEAEPGALVRLVVGDTTYSGVANTDGYIAFHDVVGGCPSNAQMVRVIVSLEAYVPIDESRSVPCGNQDLRVSLVPIAAPLATEAELHHVLGNFCNLLDSQGRVIFDPFYVSLPAAERREWLALHRAAGSTHFVLSPTIGYPGSPIPGRDLYGDPAAFVALVREVLRTPSANGKGFTPILMLDSGDPGIRDRIARFWPAIRAALGADADHVIVTPGWELVNASSVTSAEYSHALGSLRDLGYAHIWAHLAPGRGSFASHPLEPDDPWQGAESGSWKEGNGVIPEGLLYQSQAVRPNDDACDAAQEDCWLNRWEDIVPRLGAGMNGWRIVHLAYFEGPAYYFYRRQSDSAFAVRIANAAKAMCDKYGVVCGFGNGIPGAIR